MSFRLNGAYTWNSCWIIEFQYSTLLPYYLLIVYQNLSLSIIYVDSKGVGFWRKSTVETKLQNFLQKRSRIDSPKYSIKCPQTNWRYDEKKIEENHLDFFFSQLNNNLLETFKSVGIYQEILKCFKSSPVLSVIHSFSFLELDCVINASEYFHRGIFWRSFKDFFSESSRDPSKIYSFKISPILPSVFSADIFFNTFRQKFLAFFSKNKKRALRNYFRMFCRWILSENFQEFLLGISKSNISSFLRKFVQTILHGFP